MDSETDILVYIVKHVNWSDPLSYVPLVVVGAIYYFRFCKKKFSKRNPKKHHKENDNNT